MNGAERTGIDMERKEYIEMCQKCAILEERCGIKQNVPDDCRVVLGDVEFYPVSYTLCFDSSGSPVHLAHIHDLQSNSVLVCYLKKLTKK